MIYTYKCENNHKFEEQRRIDKRNDSATCECGASAKLVPSTFEFAFVGGASRVIYNDKTPGVQTSKRRSQ